ncbi:hypothetical protein TNCV_2183551 [Trichonephila clavipes]|nr:hypothetical protein TNCV_2183551 [Trichonephila clavipes]
MHVKYVEAQKRPPVSVVWKLGEGGVSSGFCEGGVMDKCVQMWTRNYGALGQTARERERGEEKGQESPGERTDGRRRRDGKEREETERESERESEARLEWRKGLSPEIGVKKTMNAGGIENGNMN